MEEGDVAAKWREWKHSSMDAEVEPVNEEEENRRR